MSLFSNDPYERITELNSEIKKLEEENARLKESLKRATAPSGVFDPPQRATPSSVSKIQAETKQKYKWWSKNES